MQTNAIRSEVKNTVLPIILSILIIHLLAMLSIRSYGYNYSALIRISEKNPETVIPDYHQKGMILFKDKGGYDGQFYYYCAIDPFLIEGKFKNAFRQQRLLYPLLCHLFALGKRELLPYSMYFINLLFLGFGMYFFIMLLKRFSLHPLWSLFYGLCPSTIMSIQYDLPSVLAISLMITSVFFYLNNRMIVTSVLLSLALLSREDSVMLLIPLLIWEYEKNKNIGRMIGLILCILPFLLWQVYLYFKLGVWAMTTSAGSVSMIPFSGLLAYLKTVELNSLVQILKMTGTMLVVLYMLWISFLTGKALIKVRHLFLYIVMAYCGLFVFESKWEDINGLFRIFYGFFPFLVLSYGIYRTKALRYSIFFIGFFFLITVIRIIFVSPSYSYGLGTGM